MTDWRSADASYRERDLDAEIQRLHLSIDGLSEVIDKIKADITGLFKSQTENYEKLLTAQHENFVGLIERQDNQFKTFVMRQDIQLKDFVDRQDVQFKGFVSRQDTQFSELVSRQDRHQSEATARQDTHFKWLMGTVVGSGVLTIASILLKKFLL